MAQPKNPPLSIRLPSDVAAAIDAAAQPGEARNAVIVRLLRKALAVPVAAQASITFPTVEPLNDGDLIQIEGEPKPRRISVPFGGDIVRRPMQKTPKR